MSAFNASVIAALITGCLGLIASVISSILVARISKRVTKVESSYRFDEVRRQQLIAFYNATGGTSPGQDVVNRVKFGSGQITQEKLDRAFISEIEFLVVVRDLYDENRHLLGKAWRQQLDSMLHDVQNKQPSSRQDKDFKKKEEEYYFALAKFAEEVRNFTKQEIDNLTDKLSNG